MSRFESVMAQNLDAFAAYRRQRGYAPRAINPPLAAFDRYLKAHNVTSDQLLQPAFFLQLRADISAHPNSVNHMLSILRSLFDFLIRRQICDANPLKDIPPAARALFCSFCLLTGANRAVAKSRV